MRLLEALTLRPAVLALFPRLLGGVLPFLTRGPIITHWPFLAALAHGGPIIARRQRLTIVAHLTVAVVAPLLIPVAVPEAPLVSAERTVVAMIAMLGAMIAPVVATIAVETRSIGLSRLVLGGRLGVLETLVQNVLVVLVLGVLGATLARRLPPMPVRPLAMLGGELLTIGHDDAVVVLRMLQIVLRQHMIAGGLRVTRKRHVFLGDMRRRAANFYVRAVGFETARKRILVLTIIVIIVVVASATAAILLSLPHCAKGSRN